MKPGHASRTAELVCMGRAVANVLRPVPTFSDPTALEMLGEPMRARVARAGAAEAPRGFKARFDRGYLRKQALVMVTRTVAIDDAVTKAAAPQVVILGAGLDGRAWRMPELAEAVVFEVDHPDSQRDKRARVQALQQTAREVRFIPVDFAKDSLDGALAAAGHDVSRPTMWIWEGVVMYLTPKEVEATLAVITRRSAAGSRLAIVYHSPHWMLTLVGVGLARLGEPLRSAFTPVEIRELLAPYGFAVLRDADMPTLAAELSPAMASSIKVAGHLRLVVAEAGRAVASA